MKKYLKHYLIQLDIEIVACSKDMAKKHIEDVLNQAHNIEQICKNTEATTEDFMISQVTNINSNN